MRLQSKPRALLWVAALSSSALAQVGPLAPDVTAAIADQPPDGQGDLILTGQAGTLVLKTAEEDRRCIREYDLSALETAGVSAARVTGRISANNALDVGSREFDVVVYGANGAAELSDFDAGGTVIGSLSYSPPQDLVLEFDLDASAPVLALLQSGAQQVGVRIQSTSAPNAPNSTTEVFLELEGAQETDWTKQTGESQLNSPRIADVDLDGYDEVVFASRTTLHVWNAQGASLPGFPRDLVGKATDVPLCVDLDGDGDLEIVQPTDDRVEVFQHTGAEVAGWSASISAIASAAGDIDGDGLPEIVTARQGSSARSYEHDGSFKANYLVSGFPGFAWESGPTLVDLNGDGVLDVLGRGTERICAWNGSGALLPGFPVDVPGETTARPVVGDLDGDGDVEIVVTSDSFFAPITATDELWVLDSQGALLPGWPVSIPMSIHDHPALVDVDQDGDLEIAMIAAGNATRLLHVLHHDGTSAAGFPVVPQSPLPLTAYSTVSSADLDGDGDTDLAFHIGNVLFAYDGSGAALPGFPQVLAASVTSSTRAAAPALGDIDRDGRVEYVGAATNDIVTALQLDAPYTSDLAGWSQDDGGSRGQSRQQRLELRADRHAVSAISGGSVNYSIDFGPSAAGRGYLLLAGSSGSGPGTPLPDAPALAPFNFDNLSLFVLAAAGTATLPGFVGFLDGDGRAAAQLPLGSSLDPNLVGVRVDLAAVLWFPIDTVSNGVGLWFTP
ncbi:MAG: FG-GAP repeat domain-containing protein [Planctomycetota bacterium]|jgi:hypothetical protein